MSDAPETMFVRAKPNGALGDWHDATSNETTAKISARPMVRYIRADLAAAKDARIAELERQLAEAREEAHAIGYQHAAETLRSFTATEGVLHKPTLDQAAGLLDGIATCILSALKEPKP